MNRIQNIIVTASVVTLAVVCLVAGSWWRIWSNRFDSFDVSDLSSDGESSVAVPIDHAIVNLVMEVKNPTNPVVAKVQSDDEVRKLIVACEEIGIAVKAIDGSKVYVGPFYDYDAQKQKVKSGYIARRTITVRVADIAKMDDLLTRLSASPAATIESVEFKPLDSTTAKTEAISKAVKDAREKADTLATAAGLKLGRIKDVSFGNEIRLASYGSSSDDVSVNQRSSFTKDTITITGEVRVRFEVIDPRSIK